MKNLLYLACAAAVFIFITGCTASGSKFIGIESVPVTEGAVYFYRPDNFIGSAGSPDIVDNEVAVTSIQNGQFIKYLTKPGHHKFYIKTIQFNKPVNLDIEAGKNYFLRTSIRKGMWAVTWDLTRIYDEDAIEEMKACCKSGK